MEEQLMGRSFHKIVLLGDAAVGKTSIRLRYFGEGFRQQYSMTLGADFAVKHLDDINSLHIWDLAGVNTFNLVRQSYYQGSHAAILIFDVTRLKSLQNLSTWIQEIDDMVGKAIPCVLVGNKVDIRKNSPNAIPDDVIEDEIGKFIEQIGMDIPYFETSALTGENVDLIFSKITNYLDINIDENEADEIS